MSLDARQRQITDTAANWTANNPVLLAGEVGYESDTRRAKVGDGITAWSSLAYAFPSSIAWGGITGTLSSQSDLNTALAGKQPLATALTNTTAAFTIEQENKLAGIAAGATVNSPDATLLNRANHTGVQAISTVTGLQTALDSKLGTSGEAATVATINGRISAGTNVTLSGLGTAASPYVIDSSGGSGDVVGPSSATDNALVRFDGTTGKLVQGSTVSVTDNGSLVLPENS
jgi:hypothetical protein